MLFSLGVSLPRRSSRLPLYSPHLHPSRAPIRITCPPRRAGMQSSKNCGLPGDPIEPSASVPPSTLGALLRFPPSQPTQTPEFSRTVPLGPRLGLPGGTRGRTRAGRMISGDGQHGSHSSPFSSLWSLGDPLRRQVSLPHRQQQLSSLLECGAGLQGEASADLAGGLVLAWARERLQTSNLPAKWEPPSSIDPESDSA